MTSNTRITTVVEMTTSADRAEELQAVLEEMVKTARSEAGCELYEMYEGKGRAGQFIFFEHWSDESSLTSHTSTSHFKHHAQAIERLVTSPIRVTLYTRAL